MLFFYNCFLSKFGDELIYPSCKHCLFNVLMISNTHYYTDLVLIEKYPNKLAMYSYRTLIPIYNKKCWNIFVTNKNGSKTNLFYSFCVFVFGGFWGFFWIQYRWGRVERIVMKKHYKFCVKERELCWGFLQLSSILRPKRKIRHPSNKMS